MNRDMVPVRRALLSVSDKQGIAELAVQLHQMGIEIISTGGTAKILQDQGIPVVPVSDVTGFPEIMDGRVKTLHPLIHGALLGLRDRHDEEAKRCGVSWIDLVVCNLYPFASAIEADDADEDTALENIDIGGPTMIRSAAKNLGWCAAVTSPSSYQGLAEEIRTTGGISFETRRRLSAEAFSHTASYDAVIQQYLSGQRFPEEVTLTFRKHSSLRYGENPHQEAASYISLLPPAQREDLSVLTSDILNGKELSYNNIQDAAGALRALREFSEPACVVVKHASPCGAAQGEDITDTVIRAFEADRLAAFGGIVSMNRTCTKEIAQYFRKVFFEIILAPDYEPEALTLLREKKNLRVLKTPQVLPQKPLLVPKFIPGGMLLQDTDTSQITPGDLTWAAGESGEKQMINDLMFAWKVLKHVKSNGILTAKNTVTLGIGQGQVSRVDAVKSALSKTPPDAGAVLASDAFFPFRDSIDEMARHGGVRAVIQPGGSVRDQEVIDACNEHGIAMVFTGIRCFHHG